MKFCYRRNDLTIRTLDLQREQHPPHRAQNYEKYEIVKGEYHHVRSGLCFRNLSVGPVGDHACHGCDQGPKTADIQDVYKRQQVLEISVKLLALSGFRKYTYAIIFEMDGIICLD